MEHEVYFRCGDELFEALSLAAVAACEESVNLYVRKFLESAHIEKDDLRGDGTSRRRNIRQTACQPTT